MGLSWGRKSAAPPVSSPARQDRCKVGGERREGGTDTAPKRIQRPTEMIEKKRDIFTKVIDCRFVREEAAMREKCGGKEG